MTFSMATDGYPTMHQPWGHWPPLHMQGPYAPPHWQGSVPSGGSCMYAMPPDYRTEKPPLTQLQELASVFPSPVKTEAPGSENDTGFMTDSHFRECDSGYGGKIERDVDRDWCRTKQENEVDREWHRTKIESEPRTWYSTVPLDQKPETNDWLYPRKSEPDNSCCSERTIIDCDLQRSRECDSGFGQPYISKEDPEVFAELAAAAEGDSGCATDIHPPPTVDSDSGCADLTDEPTSALPGFQQAFGSTEIGRFSRNDFFTNPSPPRVVEPPPPEPARKPTRKPRTPRVKHVRKERPESPKCKDPMPTVPILDGAPCNPRVCLPPYPNSPHCETPKYCSDFSHPYVRSCPPPYPPYFRPFTSFPLDYGQSWHDPRWPAYQPYQQNYQSQQWTSANVYPFMRVDY